MYTAQKYFDKKSLFENLFSLTTALSRLVKRPHKKDPVESAHDNMFVLTIVTKYLSG